MKTNPSKFPLLPLSCHYILDLVEHFCPQGTTILLLHHSLATTTLSQKLQKSKCHIIDIYLLSHQHPKCPTLKSSTSLTNSYSVCSVSVFLSPAISKLNVFSATFARVHSSSLHSEFQWSQTRCCWTHPPPQQPLLLPRAQSQTQTSLFLSKPNKQTTTKTELPLYFLHPTTPKEKKEKKRKKQTFSHTIWNRKWVQEITTRSSR